MYQALGLEASHCPARNRSEGVLDGLGQYKAPFAAPRLLADGLPVCGRYRSRMLGVRL